ncbi:MAG TPA: DNA recombination protein RmuC [Acidobacteriota bacterium]|nr:DNA recombination protein RmuC [Acidobacteriota bacterium]HQO20320.1 DNA recombination protein RmuC [Acidobacteriota bacterium]HQQ46835.1 DNA recombination protein RmuC [Acidobacteriota bacterium]
MVVDLALFAAGLALGLVLMFVFLRREKSLFNERIKERDLREAALLREKNDALALRERDEEAVKTLLSEKSRLEATLEKERQGHAEKEALLDRAKETFAQTFTALAADALHQNSRKFLEEAIANLQTLQESTKGVLDKKEEAIGGLVKPLKESLEKISDGIKEIEKERIRAYSDLMNEIGNVKGGQAKLDTTTTDLLKALKSPKARGNWGELQLRRVVEMADMLPYVDFEEQVQITTDRDTPDMIIKLPGGRKIVVDAKASMDAFLRALEAESEEEKKARLSEHGANVRNRLKELSKKEYWEKLGDSPEFVVMFLPGESYFASVLEQDMQFLDDAVKARVIPASPLTLIALLKAIAYGWKQEMAERNAAKFIGLSKELYERLCTATEHLKEMEKNLHKTVESYNRMVGSLESRVLSQGRQIASLSTKELPELGQVDEIPRSLTAPDWKGEDK